MWSIYTSRIRLRRQSAELVAAVGATSSFTLAFQPSIAAAVEVSVDGGTDGSGSVFVTGLVAGVTTTEELVYTGPGTKQTSKLYSSLVGMTSSGLDDEAVLPTVSARLVGHDGSPQSELTTVVSDYPAAIKRSNQSWSNTIGSGRVEEELSTALIPFAEHFAPREGDLLTNELNETWMLQGAPGVGGRVHQQGWNCRMRRYES